MKKYLRGTNGWGILLSAGVLMFYAMTLAQSITLASADLGRHLKNGEIFLHTLSVPQGNYYSYTNADFPFVNHHWGSGVIFYLIERMAGFAGLHIFFIAVSVAAFAIFLAVGATEGSSAAALLAAILAVPLAASRAEVRPEAFSYLFVAVFFWIIWHYLDGRISRRWLWILPVLTTMWINLHIYFFFGLGLLGLGVLEAAYRRLIQHKQEYRERLRALALVGIVSGIATLINPAGIRGALYPFKIFNNFGYRLLENQSVWFLDRVIGYPPSLYFKILFIMLVAACGFYLMRVARKKEIFSPVLMALAIGMSFLGWTAVRNFALFAMFAIPLIAIFCRSIKIKKEPAPHVAFGAFAVAGCLFVSLFIINPAFWDRYKDGGWGIGLRQQPAGDKGVSAAADFFTRESMRGPIFNDYDIGGYLIYYLFPRERVFVDNRPEAYPASFFTDGYVPLQEREDKWREESARFGFNAIIFYWHDLTPWAQTFLAHRVGDSAWAPVYADDSIIIFARRGSVNQPVIDRHEIPRSAFQSAPGL